MKSELVFKYFPNLDKVQMEQIDALYDLYKHWNEQINVISRKDIDNLYLHHVLHSLSIAKVQEFVPGSTIMDVGTGGGFPGIPLAILFPSVQFTLVDSIGKKIKVVKEVAADLGLSNVQAFHSRAEQIDDKFDFVVSRAVTRLDQFMPWVKGKFKKENHHELKNGVLYLKGGDFQKELMGRKHHLFPITDLFDFEFYQEKFVVHIS